MKLKEPEACDLATLDASDRTPRAVAQTALRVKRPGKLAAPAAAVALVLLGAAIYGGIRARANTEARLAAETKESAVPTVNVVHPQADAPDQALVLPGQTVAFIDTPIYARSSGYLKSWNFDIGARVHRGDLLAEIDTPELDQQLRQARAQLVQMQSALVQARAGPRSSKGTRTG
jgi:multidrug efflux pump subunit AcrA (membrane-fusion protein)